MKNISKRA